MLFLTFYDICKPICQAAPPAMALMTMLPRPSPFDLGHGSPVSWASC